MRGGGLQKGNALFRTKKLTIPDFPNGQRRAKACGICGQESTIGDAEIRRGTDDPEAIHDARVAVRQIRSHAASLSSVLDVDAFAPEVEQLGIFAHVPDAASADPSPAALMILVVIGAAMYVVGLIGMSRRDLITG